ncbi:hypothetical protein Tco_0072686 [Tanacetum coccineum]
MTRDEVEASKEEAMMTWKRRSIYSGRLLLRYFDDPVPSGEETDLSDRRFCIHTHTTRLHRIPSPPLPLPSLPLPLPAPSSPLLLHATDRREDVPEDDVPPWKRLCLTAPTPRFEVGESSAAAPARHPGLDATHATDYDVWDDMVGDVEETTPTTLEAVNQRVADLATTLAQDTHETYVWFEDAQDD